MPAKKKTFVKEIIILIFVVAVLGAGGYAAYRQKSSLKKGDENTTPLFTVESGPLLISVIESGTIKAREQVILKSEIEGRSTILKLVPEGKRVKKGDLLVELDATSLRDQLVKQQIDVDNSKASLEKAEKDLEVGISQTESDIAKAKLTLDFATQDLDNYTGIGGEYSNQLLEAKTKIAISEEMETKASDEYEASQKLADAKYISEIELKADELALRKAKLETMLSISDCDLLETYTHKRQIDQLESDVKQANMALERTDLKSNADIAQYKAQLKAADSIFKHKKSIQEKLEQQISKAIILAPSDGMVVYATSTKASWRRNQEPLDVGQEVHEYEELIHLPTADFVKSEISLHESNLNKVEIGMPAEITVDALDDKVFYGEVAKIAILPNAQMIFINPDLKVYPTDVFIDGESSELRTGMSCKTEIIVAEYENVKYVPIHAVVKVGDQTTVYVMNNGKMTPRAVEIGMDNNRMVHIISGLEVGEQVVLNPPLSEGEVSRSVGRRNSGSRSNGNAAGTGRPANPQAVKKPSDRSQDGPGGMSDGFKAMDKNGDGKISLKDEASETSRQFIGKLDVNGDGFVDKKEMSAAGSAPGGRS